MPDDVRAEPLDGLATRQHERASPWADCENKHVNDDCGTRILKHYGCSSTCDCLFSHGAHTLEMQRHSLLQFPTLLQVHAAPQRRRYCWPSRPPWH
jgi:hypothetical protein